MSADAFDIEEWLGAEVSGKFLPDKVQISLKKSFDDKAWDEMFPPRGRDACPSAHPAPGLKHPGAEKTTFACKLMHGCSSQSDCPRAQSPRREKRNPSSCNGPSFVRTFQHALCTEMSLLPREVLASVEWQQRTLGGRPPTQLPIYEKPRRACCVVDVARAWAGKPQMVTTIPRT